MRRRALLVAVGLAFAGTAGAVLLVALGPADPITERTLERIQPGMTRGDVAAIFTKPPGDYSTPRSRKATIAPRLYDMSPEQTAESWTGDEGEAIVVYDKAGRVVDAYFNQRTCLPESLPDKLRRW